MRTTRCATAGSLNNVRQQQAVRAFVRLGGEELRRRGISALIKRAGVTEAEFLDAL